MLPEILTSAIIMYAVVLYSALLFLTLEFEGRVTMAASVTKFIVHPSGSTRKGGTLTLNCLLGGPPMAPIDSPTSYSWFKNGQPIPGEISISLVLKDLTSQDEGNYMCGSPDVHIPQETYQLELSPTLPRPEIVPAGGAVSGRESSLSCVVEDNDPINGKVTYTWYKDSQKIEGQSGPVLRFDNVTEVDKGKYSCTARTESLPYWSPESPVFRLIPLVAPKVSIKPATSDSTVKGMLGKNITLTCETRAYPEVPANGYSWYHRPSYQLPQRSLGQNSSILILSSLTKSDSGIYVCQARNDQNFPGLTLCGQASVTVDVFYLQNISLSPDQTVQKGNPVSLKCCVDSHPKAYITWKVNGLDVHHAIGNTYNISQASCSDTGTYTCRAVNSEMPGEEISASAQVHVQCATERQIEGPNFDVIQPDAALFDFILPSKMSLVVVHPSGQDMVIVHPNCSFLISSAFLPRCLHPHCDPKRHHFYFALINVTERDEGNYSCMQEGKLRKQILNCKKELIFKRGQVSDCTCEGKQIWSGIAATVTVVAVVTGVLLVLNNRYNIFHWKKALWRKYTKRCFRSESIDMSRTFESLYENGKVYVIPNPTPAGQQPSGDDKEKETESTSPLLAKHSHSIDGVDKQLVCAVLDLVRFTLQQLTSDIDLPSFVLHNTDICKSEKIILILNRKLGVVLVCVKTIKENLHESFIEKAVNCLIETRKEVRKALQGLVKPEAVTAILALPDASEDDKTDVCEHLGSTTDVEMLLGDNKHDFQQWAERLVERDDSQVWNINTAEINSPDIAYEMTTSRFLTLAGGNHPGESFPLPPTIQSQLLSPAQMEVRDNPAKLLHMWGPPGEGKTTLLIHKALKWLADGKAVVVVVARDIVEAMIMQHQGEHPKLRICHTPEEMKTALEELNTSFPNVEICIITGILHRPGVLQSLLDAVKSKQVSAALSMFTENLPKLDSDLSAECCKLGWESAHLPQQNRHTEDTGSLLTLLKAGLSDQKPVSGNRNVRTQDKVKWKVVDHCLHQNLGSNTSCDQCKKELTPLLPLSCQDPQWNDWIAFHTGNPHLPTTDLEPLCHTMQGLGVPAVHANKHGGKAVASLPAAGMDNKQNKVPLLWVFAKLGVKKRGVLVVHSDDRDNHTNCRSERDRSRRHVEHRKQWIQATLSSTGQVVLLLLTPSPARSLLNPPDPNVQTQPST